MLGHRALRRGGGFTDDKLNGGGAVTGADAGQLR